MKIQRAITVFIMFISIVFSTPAHCRRPRQNMIQKSESVELVCADTKTVFSELKTEFQEKAAFGGVTKSSVMLFWMNAKTKSWTVTMTNGDKTCIIASGYDFVDRSFIPTSQ